MSIIWSLIEPIAGYLMLALLGGAAWWGNGKLKERKGRQKAEAAAKEKDIEHAQGIRDRVGAGRADGVHPFEDRGYRD